jgi:hypothetical protein
VGVVSIACGLATTLGRLKSKADRNMVIYFKQVSTGSSAELVPQMCALCHTVNLTMTREALAAGERWRCVRCSQWWHAIRLQRATAYRASVDREWADYFEEPSLANAAMTDDGAPPGRAGPTCDLRAASHHAQLEVSQT